MHPNFLPLIIDGKQYAINLLSNVPHKEILSAVTNGIDVQTAQRERAERTGVMVDITKIQ